MGYRVEFRATTPAPRTIDHRVSHCRFPTLLDALRIAKVEANAMTVVQATDVEVRIYDRRNQLARSLLASYAFKCA
ncbi:hypothetical protein N800_10170 [Lysobacter daejeonensis GH1-9]|uniref:Uncharacterized protein n=1 Tax=Lysobacter daejeonensis GH1-9 TaxID=1385517 RepID=A0A0A0EYF9_9GAMM|nr:hypothetical protein [Lysobacter daejeonensis]KGM55986.1 hypothetical protein N800_10170 [Lysobacter daejeonensis GH1-9]